MVPVDTVMHPIRLRIIQYAAERESFTVADLAVGMKDVPQTSLYRNVRALASAGVLEIIDGIKVRGTIQQVYTLNRQSMVPDGDVAGGEIQTSVYAILGRLMNDFQSYFAAKGSDPIADRLFLSMNTLYLNDDAYEVFIEEMYAVVAKYLKQPSTDGKSRMLTIVSSPAESTSKSKE